MRSFDASIAAPLGNPLSFFGCERQGEVTSGNLKHFRERYPISPLDHMISVINGPPGAPGVTDARRDEMAEAAAP